MASGAEAKAYCDPSSPLLLLKIAECGCDMLGALLLLGDAAPAWYSGMAFGGMLLTRTVAISIHAVRRSTRLVDLLFLGGGVALNILLALLLTAWPCPGDGLQPALCAWPLQAVLAILNAVFMTVDFMLTLTAGRGGRGAIPR